MIFRNLLRTRTRKLLSIGVAGLLAATGLIVAGAPSSQAAPLTQTTWSVSNNQAAATGVTHSYSFKTATIGSIKTITFTVSGAGLGGAPAIVKAYGIGAGAVARSGQTITYTVTAAVSVSPGISIYLELSGLTNPSTGSYTANVGTNTAAAAVIDGPTLSNTITMAATNTAVTATIDKSLTFTVDTTAFQLALDPSLPALADQSQNVVLTVQTNANSGYTLSVSDAATGLQSSSTGNPVLAKVSSGKATSVTWPGANKFGYTITGTGATVDPAFSSTKYAGYTPAGEQIASRTGPTGGTADTITVTNRVSIDYAAATGDYTDTITYTVTPNYT